MTDSDSETGDAPLSFLYAIRLVLKSKVSELYFDTLYLRAQEVFANLFRFLYQTHGTVFSGLGAIKTDRDDEN